MRTTRLRVIPEPAPNTRTVLNNPEADASFVFMTGPNTNAPDLVCGSCDRVLVHGVPRAKISAIVFHCPTCGAFNDTAERDLLH